MLRQPSCENDIDAPIMKISFISSTASSVSLGSDFCFAYATYFLKSSLSISDFLSFFLPFFLLFAAIFYSMAFAAWLAEIRLRWLAAVLFAVYCLVNLSAIWNYWSGLDLAHKPGMNGAAKYLSANVEPGQHVFLGTSFEFFNYI